MMCLVLLNIGWTEYFLSTGLGLNKVQEGLEPAVDSLNLLLSGSNNDKLIIKL
jgi:NADPH-dependent curcumin reductase CurA